MYKSLILFILISATILGCNTEKKPDQSTSQTEEATQQHNQTKLTDTYWKLVRLQGEMVPEHDEQREAHIVLKNDSLRVTGSGGCNVLNGTYELGDENRISFSKMATTMMSCPDMDTEQQFLEAFEKVEFYRVKGDTLWLNDGNEQTLTTLVSATPKENR